MFRVISLNANGIRAAARKGFFDWMADQDADVVCIQETKAQVHQLGDEIFSPSGYHCFYEDAEKKGILTPGGTVIETTSGNTGFSLAMISAIKGYRCVLCVPDKISDEKLNMLRAIKAEVVVCPSNVKPDDPNSYYSQAKIFAMPSREEGLALVQAQALACGLPIVGSARSGAEDLAELTGLGSPLIQSVTPDDEVALVRAIEEALAWARLQPQGQRELLGSRRESLSWQAYADRYSGYLADRL